MGYKQAPIFSYKVAEVLSDDTKLSDTVRNILSLQDDKVEELLGKTTRTSYRRIHDHLTTVIDRAIEILTSPGMKETSRSEIRIGLTKGLILVKHQFSRDQISRELNNTLREILTYLLDSIDKQESAKIFERARILLDAYLTLTYKHQR